MCERKIERERGKNKQTHTYTHRIIVLLKSPLSKNTFSNESCSKIRTILKTSLDDVIEFCCHVIYIYIYIYIYTVPLSDDLAMALYKVIASTFTIAETKCEGHLIITHSPKNTITAEW